jgi:hypothetical protein
MKFKKWLYELEESQKFVATMGNRDMTTGLGPTSNFGGGRTMLPISYGIDNRAFAGVMDAIGTARAKIRARKGAEPGVASQYSPLEDLRKDGILTANIPLQMPEWNGDPIHITKGLVAQIKSSFGDPLNNPKIWRVDDEMNLVIPSGQAATALYTFSRIDGEEATKLEAAINYTTALVQASMTARLAPYSHLLNLDRPQIKNRSTMPFPMKEREGLGSESMPYKDGEDDTFYKVMVCAMTFSPKNKDSEFSDDIQGEIERMVSDEKRKAQAAAATTATSTAAPAKPTASGTTTTVPEKGEA